MTPVGLQQWFAPDCGTGDNASLGSDFSALSNSHSASLSPSLAQSYHYLPLYPLGPIQPEANLPGNQPRPIQAGLV